MAPEPNVAHGACRRWWRRALLLLALAALPAFAAPGPQVLSLQRVRAGAWEWWSS